MTARGKARYLVVKLVSTAGTGFQYVTTRKRALPKLSLKKYDPIGITPQVLGFHDVNSTSITN